MSEDEIEYVGEVRRGRSDKSLTDRLLTMSREERPQKRRGVWLANRLREYRLDNGIESDSEPTEEDIRSQVKLPSRKQVQANNFSEPIKQWVEVSSADQVPWLSWNRDDLPEEEEVRPADWRCPTPPRTDISLIKYKERFEKENIPSGGSSPGLASRETVVRGDAGPEEEVVICEDFCIVRTTVGALRRTVPLDQELESDESEMEVERCTRSREVVRRRSRSVSSSPGRDVSEFRAADPQDWREQSERTNTNRYHRERRDLNHRPPTKDRREKFRSSRDGRSHGGRYERRGEIRAGHSRGSERRSDQEWGGGASERGHYSQSSRHERREDHYRLSPSPSKSYRKSKD